MLPPAVAVVESDTGKALGTPARTLMENRKSRAKPYVILKYERVQICWSCRSVSTSRRPRESQRRERRAGTRKENKVLRAEEKRPGVKWSRQLKKVIVVRKGRTGNSGKVG